MNKTWFWTSAVVAPVLVLFPACGGEEFCEESRTCTGDPGAAGAAGADGDLVGAGATGVGQGGEGASSMGATGGQGGQGPSPIGMPCTGDPECDDGDSCTGEETCVSGVCEAGVAVECGLGMECSAEQGNTCVFSSAAPWVVYAADQETTGVQEAWAVKADLLGQMEPVKIGPPLDAGWRATGFGGWSPDGSAVVLSVANEANTQVKSYLIRFGDALPAAPQELTEGMPASAVSLVAWSSTGKMLTLVRDDGLHAVDVDDMGVVNQSRVSTDGYDQVTGWIKNDNELVVIARHVATTKQVISLATRNGTTWSNKSLVSNLSLVTVGASPDRSQLGYVTEDAPDERNLWMLETTEGSQPIKLAGPAVALAVYLAPNVNDYILATTPTFAAETDVFGGPVSTLGAPPVIKQGVTLSAPDVLGGTFEGPWAPDSSRAAIFQGGAFGRQLVMYQPDAVEPWQALPHEQASRNDGEPVWSPTSELVALPTRTSATSDKTLKLIASADSQLVVDTTTSTAFIGGIVFSADGDFMAYRKGTDVSTQGGLVDLRGGLADAGAPHPFAGTGPYQGVSFATTTAELVYMKGSVCLWLDLSGAAPSAPAQVNDGGSVAACQMQPLH